MGKYAWMRWATRALIFGTLAIWIVWDIFVAIQPAEGLTESENILELAWDHPFFGVGLGVLASHFTFPWRAPEWWRKWGPVVLLVIGVIIGALDFGFGALPEAIPVIYCAVGFPLGVVFWPQRQLAPKAN